MNPVRSEAETRGWLDPHQPLPLDEALAAVFGLPKKQRARQSSSLEPHRDQITSWFEDGVQGTTIHSALKRRHGFTGSYRELVALIDELTPERKHVAQIE